MKTLRRFWQRPFPLIMAACIQFFLLTLLGMLVYPGGTWTDPATQGYRFFQNFFSDLGLLTAHNGMSNNAAALLFFVALCGAGTGLILFFLRFPALFSSNPIPRILSRASGLIGIERPSLFGMELNQIAHYYYVFFFLAIVISSGK